MGLDREALNQINAKAIHLNVSTYNGNHAIFPTFFCIFFFVYLVHVLYRFKQEEEKISIRNLECGLVTTLLYRFFKKFYVRRHKTLRAIPFRVKLAFHLDLAHQIVRPYTELRLALIIAR